MIVNTAKSYFMRNAATNKGSSLLLSAVSNQGLVSFQQRGYLPYYQKKYDQYFRPQYFDNPRRQPQSIGRIKYNSQDPLFFDYRNEAINGGIQIFVDQVKDKGSYRLPLRNIAFILYHVAKSNIYDPDLFTGFENLYREISSISMTSRHAMGGVYAYYRSNQGTRYGLDFWENHLLKNSSNLHVQDIVELAEGFSMNRNLQRDHFRKKLDELHKPILLSKWKDEATYHQRMLYKMCKYFNELEWYDEEIWSLLAKDIETKLRINNLEFFSTFYETLTAINNDPKNPLYQKMDNALKKLADQHYTTDRKWRYSLEDGGRMRTWDELVARREEPRLEDYIIKKADVDQKVLEQAKAVEKRLKRLRMAKLSKDLFDEIVQEMVKEKRSLMEMMAELDVDDQAIFDAQERIAKRTTLAAQGKTAEAAPKEEPKKAAKK